jgi:hypothetical protein
MWTVVCNGGVVACLPNEKLIRAAFAHYLRDRGTQSYEFILKNPNGGIVQTGHSGIAQKKGKK